MTYWLDAQLPPQLAPWLTTPSEVPAFSVRFLGLRDASDDAIFQAAKAAGVTLISKDSDFLERVHRLGSPPKLLYITCGNTSNQNLREILLRVFPEPHRLLYDTENIVEISS